MKKVDWEKQEVLFCDPHILWWSNTWIYDLCKLWGKSYGETYANH